MVKSTLCNQGTTGTMIFDRRVNLKVKMVNIQKYNGWMMLVFKLNHYSTYNPCIVDIYIRSFQQVVKILFCFVLLPSSLLSQKPSILWCCFLQRCQQAAVCLAVLLAFCLRHNRCGSQLLKKKIDFLSLSWQIHQQQCML